MHSHHSCSIGKIGTDSSEPITTELLYELTPITRHVAKHMPAFGDSSVRFCDIRVMQKIKNCNLHNHLIIKVLMCYLLYAKFEFSCDIEKLV